jgi:hypothetical protein
LGWLTRRVVATAVATLMQHRRSPAAHTSARVASGAPGHSLLRLDPTSKAGCMLARGSPSDAKTGWRGLRRRRPQGSSDTTSYPECACGSGAQSGTARSRSRNVRAAVAAPPREPHSNEHGRVASAAAKSNGPFGQAPSEPGALSAPSALKQYPHPRVESPRSVPSRPEGPACFGHFEYRYATLTTQLQPNPARSCLPMRRPAPRRIHQPNLRMIRRQRRTSTLPRSARSHHPDFAGCY